jgi:hypothetical protein
LLAPKKKSSFDTSIAEALKDDPAVVEAKVKDMESHRKLKEEKQTRDITIEKRRMDNEEKKNALDEENREDARIQQALMLAMMQKMVGKL